MCVPNDKKCGARKKMDQKKNKPVMDFLLSRRSHSVQTLIKPAPNQTALKKILTAAARTPDHGKLVPWRFLILDNQIANEYIKGAKLEETKI